MIGNTDPELADVLHDSPESDRYRMRQFRSPAALELFDYGHRLAAERRHSPTDDLVSKLVHSRSTASSLTEREFDTMFLLLVVVSNETTRQAIAHGMLALVEHRDQWERSETTQSSSGARAPTRSCAGRRPSSLPAHRHRTPSSADDQAGDKVVVWYGSANLDEEVFPTSLHFDVGRKPNRHVTFGGAAALLPRSPPRQARSRSCSTSSCRGSPNSS